MFAWSYKSYGAPDVLEKVNIPTPIPKPKEVLIRIYATTVSAGDWPGVLAALLTQKNEPRKFNDTLAGIDAVRAAQDAVQHVLAAQTQHGVDFAG